MLKKAIKTFAVCIVLFFLCVYIQTRIDAKLADISYRVETATYATEVKAWSDRKHWRNM